MKTFYGFALLASLFCSSKAAYAQVAVFDENVNTSVVGVNTSVDTVNTSVNNVNTSVERVNTSINDYEKNNINDNDNYKQITDEYADKSKKYQTNIDDPLNMDQNANKMAEYVTGTELVPDSTQFELDSSYTESNDLSNDPLAKMYATRGHALANIQALALKNFQATQARLKVVEYLRGKILNMTDNTQINALKARIEIENQAVLAQQAAAVNLQTLAEAEIAKGKLLEQEKVRSDLQTSMSVFPLLNLVH